MSDELLTGQIDYYRRRAAEYDATAYGDLDAAAERIAGIVSRLGIHDRVLEIACGTGMWTVALARAADRLTALDAAPEAVAIARERVGKARVEFVVADVFGWRPDARFDVVFFSAWLSHVPSDRFAAFWDALGDLLAPGGRVLFIDEHVDERGKEAYVPGLDEVVERTLDDGRTFRIVKNFVDPREWERRIGELGWDCTIRREGADWVLGEARPRAG